MSKNNPNDLGSLYQPPTVPVKVQNTLTAFGMGAAYSTTSSSLVSTGVGTSIKAGTTGNLHAALTTIITNSTAADGVILNLVLSSVGIPAAGSGAGGGDVVIAGNAAGIALGVGGNATSVKIEGNDMGLTPGTTYYIYIMISVSGGGTAFLLNEQATFGYLSVEQY